MYSFNLIEQPWIPCVRPDGRVTVLNLHQVCAQAGELIAVSGDTPLETAAIYRLLLAVLHSALRGPTSAKAWLNLWQAGALDAPWLQDYLDKWKQRFDLFDPGRPFYQSPDARARPKSVIALAMEMSSGNNASLFDHHIESEGAELSAAKAARVLITAYTFGLAGLSGMEQKFTDCPWARGVIFLVNGNNLFELLAYNLATSWMQKRIPTTEGDRPAWEMDDPCEPNRSVPLGYLDYLTWQNRRILLIPEGNERTPVVRQFTMAPALRLSADLLDPMKHYRVDEKLGNLVLRFSEERALWRDSAALLQLQNPAHARPPENFSAVASLAADYGYIATASVLQFTALGMANDQAKVEFFRQEQLPLPLAYLEDETLVGWLSDGLARAEKVFEGLQMAGRMLAAGVLSPGAAGKSWKELDRNLRDEASSLCDHWGSERFYWSAMELPFITLLNDLPEQKEQALTAWYTQLRQMAWNALDDAIQQVGETPTALRSMVHARSYLAWKLNEVFEGTPKEAN